jgi:hypothetical protein
MRLVVRLRAGIAKEAVDEAGFQGLPTTRPSTPAPNPRRCCWTGGGQIWGWGAWRRGWTWAWAAGAERREGGRRRLGWREEGGGRREVVERGGSSGAQGRRVEEGAGEGVAAGTG